MNKETECDELEVQIILLVIFLISLIVNIVLFREYPTTTESDLVNNLRELQHQQSNWVIK